jgi:hypothetical protein
LPITVTVEEKRVEGEAINNNIIIVRSPIPASTMYCGRLFIFI